MNETIMIDLGKDQRTAKDLYNRINAYTTKWRTNGN